LTTFERVFLREINSPKLNNSSFVFSYSKKRLIILFFIIFTAVYLEEIERSLPVLRISVTAGNVCYMPARIDDM
jgi:hypothetical protein